MRLTVVSQNVFGVPGVGDMRTRLRRICEEIAAQDPDVIMFQEVYTWSVFRLICALLPGFCPVYVPGRIGPSAALLTLTKQKSVGDPKHLRLSNGLRDGGRGLRKGALACTVDVVEFVNFHLRANPRGIQDPTHPRVVAQSVQVDSLVAFLNLLGDGWKVVAGDSNIEHSSVLYYALKEGAGLINPFEDTPTISAFDSSYCIDYIFHRGCGDKVETEASHLFTGQTAAWTKARKWPQMGVVSDHVGLLLKLAA